MNIIYSYIWMASSIEFVQLLDLPTCLTIISQNSFDILKDVYVLKKLEIESNYWLVRNNKDQFYNVLTKAIRNRSLSVGFNFGGSASPNFIPN